MFLLCVILTIKKMKKVSISSSCIILYCILILCQSQVAAGSINLNGTITVEVQRPGGETAMGDIVRLVEEAQSREAPVQRLADKVL